VSDLAMVHPRLTELKLKYIETSILGRIQETKFIQVRNGKTGLSH
jgi:hypothetical protein